LLAAPAIEDRQQGVFGECLGSRENMCKDGLVPVSLHDQCSALVMVDGGWSSLGQPNFSENMHAYTIKPEYIQPMGVFVWL
jgi:hypothetical protein